MDDDDLKDDQFLANNPDDVNPLEEMKQGEELEEDHDTPFSPPSGVQDRIDNTHQSTDTNIDPHEHYDEGIEGASSGDFPGEAADENDKLPPSF